MISIIVTDTRRDYQVIQIYVDISTVIAPDGSRGTSVPLNVLISTLLTEASAAKRQDAVLVKSCEMEW